MRRGCLFTLCLLPASAIAGPFSYFQTNLVSDGAVPANLIDVNLRNPWGIAFSPTSPFWIADNAAGLATLYSGDGSIQALVVTVPPAPGSLPFTQSTPTGAVFNASSSFSNDRFLFATEDGTIVGWQGGLGTSGAVRVDNSAGGAVYKGLAIAGTSIYATNFAAGRVEVFTGNYAPVSLPGAFTDPNLPSGYSPFGIQNIGGSIYVTYALKQTGGTDDVPGPGFGFVDKYDTSGVLLQRLIVGIPGDPASHLNAPWGMALAPAGFGDLGGLLLVGNFGDGLINAFNPSNGAFISSLNDANGIPFQNDGLWALSFGNNGPGFSSQKLYFTAGLNDETDGLFGSIASLAPEPGTSLLVPGALLLGLALRKARNCIRPRGVQKAA